LPKQNNSAVSGRSSAPLFGAEKNKNIEQIDEIEKELDELDSSADGQMSDDEQKR
jgi:hypothetical protein